MDFSGFCHVFAQINTHILQQGILRVGALLALLHIKAVLQCHQEDRLGPNGVQANFPVSVTDK